MPIDPPNSNGVRNRRAASPLRKNSITESEYPVVTKTVYDAIIRGQGGEANPMLKRLCNNKNKLGTLVLGLQASIRDYNPQVERQPSAIYNRLRQIEKVVQREYLNFPLRIENR